MKIGGHNYLIKIAKLDDDKLAECDYDNATIFISNAIKIQTIKESALLHEILHACNSTFGQEGLEHGIIDSLAEQLYQALKDNKLLNQKEINNLLK